MHCELSKTSCFMLLHWRFLGDSFPQETWSVPDPCVCWFGGFNYCAPCKHVVKACVQMQFSFVMVGRCCYWDGVLLALLSTSPLWWVALSSLGAAKANVTGPLARFNVPMIKRLYLALTVSIPFRTILVAVLNRYKVFYCRSINAKF